MSNPLSSAASYLASLWKSESTQTVHTFSRQSDPLQLTTTQLATIALNQQISDLLPACSLCKATLRETKQGALSFHTESGETIIFSDEKTMDQWLADKSLVDIWQIEDLREGRSGVFYKLQRVDAYGYDTFETRDALFDQLREDYGVFWKLEDQGTNQTSYIHYKPSIFGNRYVNVNHEDISSVASSLKFESPYLPASTSRASDRTSWGKGITACVLGGLLISAGRSWSQSSGQNSVSDAIAMMPGTLGTVAFKTASTFAAIAAVSRQEGGALPGALLAGMMLLPERVKGQSLCPQLVGSYDTPGRAYGVAVSGNYAYVADYASGLLIINVSNVANPMLMGSYDTPGDAERVTLSGSYAYVADKGPGLQIIDIDNMSNPVLIGSYAGAWDVAVSGNYAYIAGFPGLKIIDVSNKANPTLAGSYDTPGSSNGVAIQDNYAYIADWDSGLQIIDVSNKANPTLAGSYNTPGAAKRVAVSGTYAYVADWDSGLQIIDVSNKANPTLAGSYNTPDFAQDVAFFGNYVYVADGDSGLQIVDVSNKANPTLAGSYNTPSLALGIAILGNYAYVADYQSGLLIIDLACHTSSTSLTSSSSTTTSSTTTSSTTSSSTTTSSRSSSTFSSNPTTTTIFSSTTIPTDESSTSSTSSTNPLGSTTNNPSRFSTTNSPSSTRFTTAPSTTRTTTIEDNHSTVSGSSLLLWFGLLGGGTLCLCFIGGTVFILQRRRKTLPGSKGEMPIQQNNYGEEGTYIPLSDLPRLTDVASGEDWKREAPTHYVPIPTRAGFNAHPKE